MKWSNPVQLVVFSKKFRDMSIPQLAELAHRHGFGGFDLCIRAGHPVNPENVGAALPEAADMLRRAGVSVPMVTAETDLTLPDHPTAEPILAAMAEAGVPLLKLGYFKFQDDYWAGVERIRVALAGWQELACRYGVKVCYHTHSRRCMGLNSAALCHLIRGLDPRHVGAYLDPGHLLVEGEEFAVGVAMVREYLCAVALKDVLLVREEANGHGRTAQRWVPAGMGMVDWTAVFDTLRRERFAGPLSIHAEFHIPPESFMETFEREVRFYQERCGER